MTIRIDSIYRYPVKGFRADRLEFGNLKAGAGLPWDRAFAFTSGNMPPPVDDKNWVPSRTFIQLTVYPQLAGFTAQIDEQADTLTVTCPKDKTASTPLTGQNGSDDDINALMRAHFSPGPEADIHLHRLAGAHGHWDFTDTSLSIINLATVEWLEWVSALKLSHLRFRGNIYVTGLEPFAEFALVGRTFRIGDTRIKILRPAMRCAATAADPISSDTSIDVPAILRGHTKHLFCGVYAKVIEGGTIYEDDHLRPVDEAGMTNPALDLPERTPDPVLWPRPVRVERVGDSALVLEPLSDSWPFLPANAGARLMLHPGLDYMDQPVRLALSERGESGKIIIPRDGLENIIEGAELIVSGPVERSSGRA